MQTSSVYGIVLLKSSSGLRRHRNPNRQPIGTDGRLRSEWRREQLKRTDERRRAEVTAAQVTALRAQLREAKKAMGESTVVRKTPAGNRKAATPASKISNKTTPDPKRIELKTYGDGETRQKPANVCQDCPDVYDMLTSTLKAGDR